MGHAIEKFSKDGQAPTGSEMERAGAGVSSENEEILGG